VELTRQAPVQGAELDVFLRAHAIDAQRVEHPPVMTVEESERLVPPLPGAKTKNLFLRDKKGARHFLVTVPHDLVVDLAFGLRPRGALLRFERIIILLLA